MSEMLETGISWEALRADYFTRRGNNQMASECRANLRRFEKALNEQCAQAG